MRKVYRDNANRQTRKQGPQKVRGSAGVRVASSVRALEVQAPRRWRFASFIEKEKQEGSVGGLEKAVSRGSETTLWQAARCIFIKKIFERRNVKQLGNG